MLRKAAISACLLLALTVSQGCGGTREDPILRLAAEESLTTGKQLMEAKKYFRAREYLTHAFEVEPNSASGREALLLVADCHFLEGGSQNYIKAEAKYRDFQNRFPTSDRASYVQYQVASSLARRMRRPDRDQSISRDALEAYQDLLRLFPSSDFAPEAREQIGIIRGTLAEAEYLVGRYNYRRGLYAKCGRVCFEAAAARLEGIFEEYPTYQAKEKAYELLTLAYLRAGQRDKADEYFAALRENYPNHEGIKEIEKTIREVEKRQARLEARQKNRQAGTAADSGAAEADASDEPAGDEGAQDEKTDEEASEEAAG